MPAPINYTGGFSNPMDSIMKTLQLGQTLGQMGDRMDARALAQQNAAAKAERDQKISEAFDLINENPTAENYVNLANLLPPEQGKSIRESYDLLDEAKQKTFLRDSANIFAAFKAGNPDIAVGLLRDRIEAAKNAGDTQSAQRLQSMVDLSQTGPQGRQIVEDMFGMNVAMMPGGKEAIEGVVKFADERRLEIEHPDLMELKKQELSKATSDAEKAEIELKYTKQIKNFDLMKAGSDLGLSKAQTQQIIKDTNMFDEETAKMMMAIAGMKIAGTLTAEQAFSMETTLRNDFTKRAASTADMKRSHEVLKASGADSGPVGDVALVFAFMKMLDPGSVVRESEFAVAEATAGRLDRLYMDIVKKTQTGERLTPDQRKQYMELADKYMEAAIEHEDRVKKGLEKVVMNYGLNPEHIFVMEHGLEGQTPAQPGATPQAKTNLDSMKALALQRFPGEAAEINSIKDEEEFRRRYKVTAGMFDEQNKPADAVEVDY